MDDKEIMLTVKELRALIMLGVSYTAIKMAKLDAKSTVAKSKKMIEDEIEEIIKMALNKERL